ncbi:Phage-related minor tail protein [Serratia ficaria]|nr:Phage-related minor tail protein [Serratia ficaria]CAI1510947.1 Phage-related minor tail protein [Serratia ficaria]CAI2497139.1 Phage-related minor tail protein [Serratia ficaria]CAI2784985.1 Phage-related minor tail protein [Serratia ficaria]
MLRRMPLFINPLSLCKAPLMHSVLTLCECLGMADVASLAVGLYLNDANFRNKLVAAYRTAGDQSGKFNRQAQQDAKKTDEAYQRVGQTVSSLKGTLAGLAGVAGLGFSLGSIITTTRQYGQALSDLSAITGATGAQLKQFDEAAQQMGRTTEYSASQAAEALKLMASAKPELLNTADGLTTATNSALILAQAAGTTLPDATKTLALSLNQFGASASQADRYINVLAAGAKYGSSEIADTAAAIKNGGVAAAQAGIGFEQLNAAIQVLAEREIKGGEAGTGLRNVILNLEKGTDKTLKPSVVGLSTALENLSKKNLSTTQAVKLFGLENINAASILVSNRSKLDDLTKSLTGTQTAHEQAATRVNNLNGDLMGLTSAFEGLIIKVGQASGGPLRTGVQSVTESINGLADNFNMVASVALYTLIPVMSTKLTAGIRESIGAWREQQAAVRSAALAQASIAQKTIDAANATLLQNNAEFGRVRAMEKTAKQFGLNVSYTADYNRLIREETEATRAATVGKNQLDAANKRLSVSARAASVATGLARGALSLVGGPFGAAMLAGSALLYFHDQAVQARTSAINLKNAVVETTSALMQLSDKQLAVKQLDLGDQLESQLGEQNKLQNQLKYMNKQIDQTNQQGWVGDLFGNKKEMQAARTRAEGDLESVNQGIQKTRDNLENVGKARFLVQTGVANVANQLASDIKTITSQTQSVSDEPLTPWGGEDPAKADKKGQQALKQYQQLRQEIEVAHSISLAKIDLEERNSQAKLIASAKAAGASQTDLQRVMSLNAENYQRQRLELAEQYAPGQATVRKEQETSRELKALYDARLLTERDYLVARHTLQQDMARERLKAEADAIAAPRQNIAGDVDPSVQLSNQLAQQQAQYQAYYQQGYIDKQRYEQLMQAATQESTDAQYQQAMKLYAGQSQINKLQLGLVDTTRERTTNMLTGLLTGTQTFKDSMVGLFSSLTQSIVQNLIDMAARALLTKTILSSFMSFGGGAAGAGNNPGTVPMFANAKGGVYSSPSLSSYSGQVVSQPTMFAFAKGAGLMGEAGPEAIMPLKRGADGSLGVQANGATGNQTMINVDITINPDGSSQVQATSGFESAGNDIANYIDQRFRVLLNKSMSQGGTLNRAIKGSR